MLDSRRDCRYRGGAHRDIRVGLGILTFHNMLGTSSGVPGFLLTRIHPSAWNKNSRKFTPRNSNLAYKDSPFGGCALALLGSTISTLLSQSAPHPPPRTSGSAFLLPAPRFPKPSPNCLCALWCTLTPAHNTHQRVRPLAGGPSPIGAGLCRTSENSLSALVRIHRRFIRARYYAPWERLLATRGGPK
jgi:hypothetical protein